ncbi:MAG: cytochrome c3 family protein [Verrucomicrobiota bacterium]
MSCISCHNPHGEDINKPKGMMMARANDTCYQCHRQQAQPHVFEHQAMREGCISCHSVHGSVNDKMLTERDVNLCIKCHAQINNTAGNLTILNRNHTDLNRGTCWSGGCHTAPHGSNINAHFRY